MLKTTMSGRSSGDATDAGRDVYMLAAGEMLFHEGDAKRSVYRIESGAVCTYQVSGVEPRRTVNLSHSGDWLGFGYLDHHVSRARALVDTRLTRYPRHATDVIVDSDLRARRQLADAIEREFEYTRETSAKRAANPVVRVSALLISLASMGEHDGRDPRIIVDSMPFGLVAECLMMSVETLAATLRLLEAEELIVLAASGIRIVNYAALERIADAGGFAPFRAGTGRSNPQASHPHGLG